jgi:hypothetical protein
MFRINLIKNVFGFVIITGLLFLSLINIENKAESKSFNDGEIKQDLSQIKKEDYIANSFIIEVKKGESLPDIEKLKVSTGFENITFENIFDSFFRLNFSTPKNPSQNSLDKQDTFEVLDVLNDFEEIKLRLKTPVIFDGRNLYSTKKVLEQGFTYYAIGKSIKQ